MINGTIQGKSNPDNGINNQAICDWAGPLQIVVGDLEDKGKKKRKQHDKFKDNQIVVHGRIRGNKLDGHVRIFGKIPNETLYKCGVHKLVERGLGFVGRYKNGIPTGECWKGNQFIRSLKKSTYASC